MVDTRAVLPFRPKANSKAYSLQKYSEHKYVLGSGLAPVLYGRHLLTKE